MRLTEDQLKRLIRDVPDFPQPGIIFKDITPLLADKATFKGVVEQVCSHWADRPPDVVTAIEARGFIPGGAVALDAAQLHRLRNVLRLGSGSAVAAFNERDGEWLCHLAEQGRRGAALVPERRLRTAEAEPDLWLLFAPIKRARLDWLVEKATELGAAALVPVWTAHTQPERFNRELAALTRRVRA